MFSYLAAALVLILVSKFLSWCRLFIVVNKVWIWADLVLFKLWACTCIHIFPHFSESWSYLCPLADHIFFSHSGLGVESYPYSCFHCLLCPPCDVGGVYLRPGLCILIPVIHVVVGDSLGKKLIHLHRFTMAFNIVHLKFTNLRIFHVLFQFKYKILVKDFYIHL